MRPVWRILPTLVVGGCVAGGSFDNGKALDEGLLGILAGTEVGFSRCQNRTGLPIRCNEGEWPLRIQFLVRARYGFASGREASLSLRFSQPIFFRANYDTWVPGIEAGTKQAFLQGDDADLSASIGVGVYWKLTSIDDAIYDGPNLRRPLVPYHLLGFRINIAASRPIGDGDSAYVSPEFRTERLFGRTAQPGLPFSPSASAFGATGGVQWWSHSDMKNQYLQLHALHSWNDTARGDRLLVGFADERIH